MSNETKVIVGHPAKEKIRLLSDGQLYQDALDFIDAQGTIDGKTQLVSLLNYTQSWTDLKQFVAHQSKRDWIGKKSDYGQYYVALDVYLRNLDQQTLAWFPASEDYQTRKDQQIWHETHAIYVAREFIQHLFFENSYRERQR